MTVADQSAMWKRNGLSIVLFMTFLLTWVGQFFTGMHVLNGILQEHQQSTVTALQYLTSGHFLESTFENWESEFFQMALFAILTVTLYQKGSSESKPPPGEKSTDDKPESKPKPKRYFKDSPLLRKLYENSLSIALFILFVGSFAGHLYGGWRQENLMRSISPTHEPPLPLWDFATSSDFWFQSLQNWQSEFLSIGVMVVLTIFLRQKDSAQSKDVDAPHSHTGP